MGLRAGSTPSRSLETKEKCLATLTFMGKDYHHHHHPQQPPEEESGSFSIAETVDCSKPPDPASARPCTCRLFFQQPYKWLHDISPWACVYTYTPVALHACDLPHVRQASQRVPASAFASVWASAEMANRGAHNRVWSLEAFRTSSANHKNSLHLGLGTTPGLCTELRAQACLGLPGPFG